MRQLRRPWQRQPPRRRTECTGRATRDEGQRHSAAHGRRFLVPLMAASGAGSARAAAPGEAAVRLGGRGGQAGGWGRVGRTGRAGRGAKGRSARAPRRSLPTMRCPHRSRAPPRRVGMVRYLPVMWRWCRRPGFPQGQLIAVSAVSRLQVSKPRPPSRLSLAITLSMALRVSLPSAPLCVSLPLPPVRVSLP